MLSKRVFWLTCAAIASWLIWMRLRQRRDEFAASTPHFAPPSTFAPYTPAAPPAPPPAQDETTIAPAATLNDLDVATDVPAAEPAQPPTALPETAAPGAAPDSGSTTHANAPAEQAADDAPAEDDIEISGYCMRCKTKRPIQNAHRETTESGRPAARGTCPVCGANMFTFLATDEL